MTQDIFADIEAAGENDKGMKVDLGPITQLVNRQVALEEKPNDTRVKILENFVNDNGMSISEVEAVLKARKKALFGIRQIQIPELMKEFGLESLTTSDGTKVEIKGDVSVTVKDPSKLYKYLRDHDAGDLIKNIITTPVDSEETRKKVLKALSQIGCILEEKESVHSATLKKYVKNQLKEGVKIPEDILNTFEYQYSKIK